MQIVSNSIQQKSAPSFQARFKNAEVKNCKKQTSDDHIDIYSGAINSSIIIDGEEIKTGDTFYIQNANGELSESEFNGVYKKTVPYDGCGRIDTILLYKSKESYNDNDSGLSKYHDGDTQIFSKKGIEQLGKQIKLLLYK